jgi:hypothetical protein
MKLNDKTVRRLRRALRTQANELVKLRKELIASGLTDHWRWKKWISNTPEAVRKLPIAAEVLDCAVGQGDTAPVSTLVLSKECSRRRKPLRLVRPEQAA